MTELTKSFNANSPLMAEALSFREALAFAESLGLDRICVENDSLELIQTSRNECKRGEIFNIITDIQILKGRFQQAGFTWVSRQGNQAAHQVALLASRGHLPRSWAWNPSPIIQTLINTDKFNAHSRFPFDPGTSNLHLVNGPS